jgi:acetoin utilization protein AcuC
VSDPVVVIEADAAATYDLGPEHPFTPLRRALAADLIRAYGGFDAAHVEVRTAPAASDEEIGRAHDPDYIAAVRRLGGTANGSSQPEALAWGLASAGDTPAFAGVHEAAAGVAGASAAAALAVASGDARRSFTVGGGLHHALSNRAAGFCVYNDCAVAIHALLDAGVERVAYVDIDVHHGDGTQWIFYEDPRVLTASVHESGRYLFPGTGALGERGHGAGEGTSVNIPLPPFAGDGPYLRAIEEVIAPAVRAFQPDVLVTQDGADPHHRDPLAHLAVTMPAFPRAYALLRELADDAAGGRWVALGGGGYNDDVVPRAWTMLFAELSDQVFPDEVPAEWHRDAERRTGQELTRNLLADTQPDLTTEELIRGDHLGEQAVADARAVLT